MKTILFCLIALTTLFTEAPDPGFSLKVNLEGLKSTKGTVQICLMNEEGQFLKSCFIRKTYRFEAGKELAVTFTELEPGEYAIMAFHDSDDDGKLNYSGIFGLPSEPYAFSNNPSTRFGPPAHRKCVFGVEGDMALGIEF